MTLAWVLHFRNRSLKRGKSHSVILNPSESLRVNSVKNIGVGWGKRLNLPDTLHFIQGDRMVS